MFGVVGGFINCDWKIYFYLIWVLQFLNLFCRMGGMNGMNKKRVRFEGYSSHEAFTADFQMVVKMMVFSVLFGGFVWFGANLLNFMILNSRSRTRFIREDMFDKTVSGHE